MAQKHINYGTPNGKDGEFVRDAFIKSEDNFTELYGRVDNIQGIISDPDGGILNTDNTFTWLKYSLYPDGFNNGVAAMSDTPLDGGTLYRGLGLNKDTKEESDNPADYEWEPASTSVIQNADGTYLWILYADTANPFSGVTTNPLGKAWIGFANYMDSPDQDFNPVFYDWTQVIVGDGIPVAGTTKFAWFKYSKYDTGFNPSNQSDMVDIPSVDTNYLGIAYNKDTSVESDDASDYTWSLLSGDILQANGLWTWVRYAYTPTSGMQDTPEGAMYIGFAFDKLTPESESIEADLYESYQWSPLYGNNTDTTDTGQNNKVREIDIRESDLAGKVFSESTIAEYINENGLIVEEDENIIFNLVGDTGEPTDPVIVVKELDPTLPLTLTLGTVTETTAALSWVCADTAITSYKLFRRYTLTNNVVVIAQGLTTSDTLTGLNDASTYVAWVVAYDVLGNQKLSNEVTIDTPKIFVASTPYFTELNPLVTNTTIDLSWDISTDFAATRYVLQYAAGGVLYDGALKDFQVSGLNASTSYQFIVTAYLSDNTPSNPSATLTVSTGATVLPTLTPPIINSALQDAGNIILNIALDPTATAEWDSITGFEITYFITSNPAKTFTKYVEKSSTGLYAIPNTLTGVKFQFTAKSVNIDVSNISAASNALQYVVPEPTIVTPTSVKVTMNDPNGVNANEGIIGVFNGQPNETIKIKFGFFGDILPNNASLYLGVGSTLLYNTYKEVTFVLDASGKLQSGDETFTINSAFQGTTYTISALVTDAIAVGVNPPNITTYYAPIQIF